MPEFVRVYDAALKRKYSVPEEQPLADGLEVVDDNAYDHNGDPLPPEFDVTKGGKQSAAAPVQKES